MDNAAGSSSNTTPWKTAWAKVRNWKNDLLNSMLVPKYEAPAAQKVYNEADICTTEQYMTELDTRRDSIAGDNAQQSIEYYWQSSQNDSMLKLDDDSDQDGDIEEEAEEDIQESLPLHLSYSFQPPGNDQNNDDDSFRNFRRMSQEVDSYNLGGTKTHNFENHATIQELSADDSDESDSSVLTAILSNGTNGAPSDASASSPAAMSVNSITDKECTPAMQGVNANAINIAFSAHRRKSTDLSAQRLSAFVSESEDDEQKQEEEEDESRPRGRSFSLMVMASPTFTHERSVTHPTLSYHPDFAQLYSSPQRNSLSTPHNTELGLTPYSIQTMNGSDAPPPPSPLQDTLPTEEKEVERSAPVENAADHNDQNEAVNTMEETVPTNGEEEKIESTIFVHKEDDQSKNFYVHCPAADDAKNEESEQKGSNAPSRSISPSPTADTFIAKESEDETISQLSDSVVNAENENTNTTHSVNSSLAVADMSVSKLLSIGSEADTVKLHEVATNNNNGNDHEQEDSALSKSNQYESNLTPTNDSNELSSNALSTTLNSWSTQNEVVDAPQLEPTKSAMKAPRPMISNIGYNNNRRRYTAPSISRTDLQLDASSEETTGSDDIEFDDALDTSSGGDSAEMKDDDDYEDNTNEDAELPFGGNTNGELSRDLLCPRSGDVVAELQQRKTAMDAHYRLPHRLKTYMCWYFGFCIVCFVLIIIVTGPATFDKSVKYVNTPRFEKYSFLRNECRNVSNYSVTPDEEYLMDYGYQYVDTRFYSKYTDAIHWMVLSAICIASVFVIYPLIMFVCASCMVFRYDYYTKHGIDPTFACKCCPLYYRYSSPNAPQLTSVLDPNNLYLFNHCMSPRISPTLKQSQNARKQGKNSKPGEAGVGYQRIGLQTVTDVEEEEAVQDEQLNEKAMKVVVGDSDDTANGDEHFFEENENRMREESDAHSMGREPPSPMPEEEKYDDAMSEYEQQRQRHERTVSDVLRQTLLEQSFGVRPNGRVTAREEKERSALPQESANSPTETIIIEEVEEAAEEDGRDEEAETNGVDQQYVD